MDNSGRRGEVITEKKVCLILSQGKRMIATIGNLQKLCQAFPQGIEGIQLYTVPGITFLPHLYSHKVKTADKTKQTFTMRLPNSQSFVECREQDIINSIQSATQQIIPKIVERSRMLLYKLQVVYYIDSKTREPWLASISKCSLQKRGRLESLGRGPKITYVNMQLPETRQSISVQKLDGRRKKWNKGYGIGRTFDTERKQYMYLDLFPKKIGLLGSYQDHDLVSMLRGQQQSEPLRYTEKVQLRNQSQKTPLRTNHQAFSLINLNVPQRSVSRQKAYAPKQKKGLQPPDIEFYGVPCKGEFCDVKMRVKFIQLPAHDPKERFIILEGLLKLPKFFQTSNLPNIFSPPTKVLEFMLCNRQYKRYKKNSEVERILTANKLVPKNWDGGAPVCHYCLCVYENLRVKYLERSSLQLYKKYDILQQISVNLKKNKMVDPAYVSNFEFQTKSTITQSSKNTSFTQKQTQCPPKIVQLTQTIYNISISYQFCLDLTVDSSCPYQEHSLRLQGRQSSLHVSYTVPLLTSPQDKFLQCPIRTRLLLSEFSHICHTRIQISQELFVAFPSQCSLESVCNQRTDKHSSELSQGSNS